MMWKNGRPLPNFPLLLMLKRRDILRKVGVAFVVTGNYVHLGKGRLLRSLKLLAYPQLLCYSIGKRGTDGI